MNDRIRPDRGVPTVYERNNGINQVAKWWAIKFGIFMLVIAAIIILLEIYS